LAIFYISIRWDYYQKQKAKKRRKDKPLPLAGTPLIREFYRIIIIWIEMFLLNRVTTINKSLLAEGVPFSHKSPLIRGGGEAGGVCVILITNEISSIP
jgi:hypothetical protein